MSETTQTKNIDDELLEWGVEKRKEFIVKMMKPNGDLPDDPKEKALVLKAMEGIEKTAVARKRLKIEDKAATNSAETAKLLSQFYERVASQNPFVIDQNMQEVPARVAPRLPDNVPEVETVEGEMETTPSQGSYDEFMAQMNGPVT